MADRKLIPSDNCSRLCTTTLLHMPYRNSQSHTHTPNDEAFDITDVNRSYPIEDTQGVVSDSWWSPGEDVLLLPTLFTVRNTFNAFRKLDYYNLLKYHPHTNM